MNNLVEFLRMFLSYGLVLIVCVAVILVAVFIGIKLRKAKNIKEATQDAIESETKN